MDKEIRIVPDDILVARSQYDPQDPAIHLAARWAVYAYAKEPVDPLALMYGLALKHGVTQEGTVLDVGCNDGQDLRRLCDLGHTGLMYGVDPAIDPESFPLQNYASKGEAAGAGILPVQGVLEEVYIPNCSIDLLLSKFMLYHVKDVKAGLSRFDKLLADEGVLAIATSGAGNKSRQHDELEPLIAEKLHVRPPKRFNARFNAEIAERLLPEYFQVVEQYTQSTTASFDTRSIGVFIRSLESMRNVFRPQPTKQEFSRALDRAVVPRIAAEIALHGQFTEVIDRRFYVCKKRVVPRQLALAKKIA
jgi:SAM-dependent methyltransferase